MNVIMKSAENHKKRKYIVVIFSTINLLKIVNCFKNFKKKFFFVKLMLLKEKIFRETPFYTHFALLLEK